MSAFRKCTVCGARCMEPYTECSRHRPAAPRKDRPWAARKAAQAEGDAKRRVRRAACGVAWL